jgi:membrane protein DedA with SNARE-associated domain
MAVAAGADGCGRQHPRRYFTWSAGKKGGEKMLDRCAPPRFRSRLRHWVERHGELSVCLAAMLPPPIPLMPFLLGAGALGVTRKRMILALTIARSMRYGAEAALGIFFGRRVLRAWRHYSTAGWSSVILYTFLGLLAAAVVYGVWKYRRDQRHERDVPVAA